MPDIIPPNQNILNSNLSGKNKNIKDGVTIAWLLSTLGGRNNSLNSISNVNSNLSKAINNNNNVTKNVKKKDIMNVSIPKVCKVIETNNKEFSLRYVSNLMYGVTLCYNKKSEYLLNDINGLMIHLTNLTRIFNVNLTKSKNGKNAIKSKLTDLMRLGNISKTYINDEKNKNKKIFLDDDPNFDINININFENILLNKNNNKIETKPSDASLIRKRDILDELTNNIDTLPSLNDSNKIYNNHNTNTIPLFINDDDQLPFDIDFELDINEDGINQGTLKTTSDDLSSNNNNFKNKLDLNSEVENSNLENNDNFIDLSHIALNLTDDNDTEYINKSTDENNKPNSILKNQKRKQKRKYNVTSNIVSRIEVDYRTNYSTENLRFNSINYYTSMKKKIDMVNKKINKKLEREKVLKSLNNLANYSIFFQNSYISIIDENSNINFSQIKEGNERLFSIEKQRNIKPSRSDGTNNSNSISSHERGRRLNFGKDSIRNSFFSNDNNEVPLNFDIDSSDFTNIDQEDNIGEITNDKKDLLNLQQIDEDLENHSFEPALFDNSYFNLNIPPSSFDQFHQRTRTNSSDINVIDELRSKNQSTRKSYIREKSFGLNEEDDDETPSSIVENSKKIDIGNTILDQQSRNFYDYIKQRSEKVGKHTHIYPLFDKKLLFEDVVPSLITEQDSEEVVTSAKKRTAANTFLLLLNLATRDLINLQKYEEDDKSQNLFSPLNGDDIIVYI